MKAKTKEFFAQVDVFLETWNKVLKEGFFTATSAEVSGYINYPSIIITVKATGYIANEIEDKEESVVPYIDPASIMKTVRNKINLDESYLAADFNFNNCEIGIKDWPRWDKTGNKIIGKRGLEFSFLLKVNTIKKQSKNPTKSVPKKH
jgi:hypothetical protein